MLNELNFCRLLLLKVQMYLLLIDNFTQTAGMCIDASFKICVKELTIGKKFDIMVVSIEL